MRRIVITGMGLVSPLGCELDTVWKALIEGKSGISAVTKYDPSAFRTRIAGNMSPDFTTEGIIEFKENKHLDDVSRYAIVAAHKAVKDSGIDFSQEDPTRCAAIIGTGVGGLETLQEQEKRYLNMGPAKMSPFTIPRLMPNSPAGHISILYNLRGASFSVNSACASAGHAVSCMMDAIRAGRVDVGVTGGTEACVIEIAMGSFCAMRAMSERNDDPQHASRPFDLDRDGFVMGEGAGILIFEELEHAKKRCKNLCGSAWLRDLFGCIPYRAAECLGRWCGGCDPECAAGGAAGTGADRVRECARYEYAFGRHCGNECAEGGFRRPCIPGEYFEYKKHDGASFGCQWCCGADLLGSSASAWDHSADDEPGDAGSGMRFELYAESCSGERMCLRAFEQFWIWRA